MELHHGLTSDFEPIYDDKEVALRIGTTALWERRENNKNELLAARAKAEELFALYPNGVQESKLIHELKSALGVSLRIAVAAVDELPVVKDWETGFIAPLTRAVQ